MSLDDVKQVVATIAAIGNSDCERAHGMEDTLYKDVLAVVAATAPEPWRSLAVEALRAQELDFDRWYA